MWITKTDIPCQLYSKKCSLCILHKLGFGKEIFHMRACAYERRIPSGIRPYKLYFTCFYLLENPSYGKRRPIACTGNYNSGLGSGCVHYLAVADIQSYMP